MSDQQDAERGQQAVAVLQNPAYLDAYAQLDGALVKLWRESRDPQDREDLHRMLGLLTRLQAIMEGAVRSGHLAEKEILRKRNLAERMGLAAR